MRISIDEIKSTLAALPVIRQAVLKVLKFLERDIAIENPYTNDRLQLNLYRHKSYWYFRKGREREIMEKFRQLIPVGSIVIEIGGHIGFITQYFSKLVGNSGKVIVFEPGLNNLHYIRENVKLLSNTLLVQKAISDRTGRAIFYEDNITGQNNSLLENFKGAEGVAKSHGELLKKSEHLVEVTSLDDYLKSQNLTCDFIKIDIEGFELFALRGMSNTIRYCKALMVEVSDNQKEVSDFFKTCNFSMYDSYGQKLNDLPIDFSGNIFAIRN
jgi:FkbM family methyltransferase